MNLRSISICMSDPKSQYDALKKVKMYFDGVMS